MRSSDAIISIKPQFAEAILSRIKSVELRRRIPNTLRGTRLWIYATRPVGSVVGTALVTDIIRGAPDDIWSAYKNEVGISRDAFFAYYKDANEAIALTLGNVQRRHPISIDQLRKLWDGFHPPQVLAKLSADDATKLEVMSRVA